MRGPDAIPDAPVYKAKIEEMGDLCTMLANAYPLAAKHGAVRIDPPEGWVHPPLRISSKSQFFVRMQSLPEAPFMDSSVTLSGNTSNIPHPKTKKHTPVIIIDDDEEDNGKFNKQALNIPRKSNQRDHIHTPHRLDHTPNNAGVPVSLDIVIISRSE